MSFKTLIIFTVSLLCIGFSQALPADLLGFDIKLTNGYRQDSLSASIESAPSYHSSLMHNRLKLDSIALYQIGFKGKLSLLDFFIRLDASYGWAGKGKYCESFSLFPSGYSNLKASIHKGHTKDLTVGGGYHFNLVPFYHCFSIGPMAGWSYHEQLFKTSSAHFNSPYQSELSGLTYSNRWQGPWVGIDLECRLCEFALNAGYEYHLASWHATSKLSDLGELSQTLSARPKSDYANGQVLYLDGKWNFNLCWYAGLGLKLQEWKAVKGRWKRLANQVALLNSSSEDGRLKQAKWRSFAITLDIGFSI